MITLSAPAKSGYRKEFETTDEMLAAAASLLRTSVEDMVCVQCNGQDDRFYFYSSQEEADADTDGAYAVQSTGTPLLKFVFTAGRHEDAGNFETYADAQDRATYLAQSWREHVTVTERFDKSNTWVVEVAAQ